MIAHASGRRCVLVLAVAMTAAATPARAEDFKLGENPASTILKWRPTTPDPEVKDFVRASRPADGLDYAPLRSPRAERPKLKTKEGLKEMTDGLEAKAAAARARAGVSAAVPATPRKAARPVE